MNDKKPYIVFDGQEQETPVAPLVMWFSPDSRHCAYVMVQNGKMAMVIDGKKGKEYDEIARTVIFSDDSAHIAYTGLRDKKSFVVFDGVESAPYESVSSDSLMFSPDSTRFAFCAREGKERYYVVDNKPQKRYSNVRIASFSPDSKHFGYAAQKDGKWMAILDGVEGRQYDDMYDYIYYSPDSQHVAYSACNGKTWHAVIDGVENGSYQMLGPIVFSPDSKRTACGIGIGKQCAWVVDGHLNNYYALCEDFHFSPDSKHYAYKAMFETNKNNYVGKVVYDGQEGPAYVFRGGDKIVFSPDSRHIAYAAQHCRESKFVVVTDGKESKPSDAPVQQPVFSSDSKYLAYIVPPGIVVVNGKETILKLTSASVAKIVFDSPNHFHALGIELAQTEEEEREQPIEKQRELHTKTMSGAKVILVDVTIAK